MPSFPILIDFLNKRFFSSVFKGSETIGELMKPSHAETSSLSPSRRVASGKAYSLWTAASAALSIIRPSGHVHFLDMWMYLPCSSLLGLRKHRPGPARSVQLSSRLIKNVLRDARLPRPPVVMLISEPSLRWSTETLPEARGTVHPTCDALFVIRMLASSALLWAIANETVAAAAWRWTDIAGGISWSATETPHALTLSWLKGIQIERAYQMWTLNWRGVGSSSLRRTRIDFKQKSHWMWCYITFLNVRWLQ